MTPSELPPCVAVTGAAGNLGRKLVAALLADAACTKILAMDRVAVADADPRVIPVVTDLTRRDAAWADALAEAGAVVHLAAQNPFPDADWTDAARSFDMTASVIDAAVGAGVRRFVFASSNHVMGGYKESDVADRPGALGVALPPRVGTRAGEVDSTAYATAKLMGERLLASRVAVGGMTGVSLRIGWCQPGDNDPASITATGIPALGASALSVEELRDRRWFRGMWLSNRDFTRAVLAALRADPAGWPEPAVVVNAMSDNAGSCWDLADSARLIGYRPLDRIG